MTVIRLVSLSICVPDRYPDCAASATPTDADRVGAETSTDGANAALRETDDELTWLIEECLLSLYQLNVS